ncbi:MAG: hypothetical protein EON57_00170 [Alphaproteobacteria bacterium]|nr:MAG: hypothetical protein EON57_00170 [Alphaproteobacteria bacterium]
MDEVTEERRKALAASIRAISIEELKKLGDELFPFIDHPWREKYFSFITGNSGAAFYHATTYDRIHIIYCAAQDKGMWFLPGSGMGPLQAKGLGIMKQLAEGAK